MKKFIFISAIAALALAGCKIDESTTTKANHIYLSPTNIAALEVGSTQQISAVVTPASIENKHIVWVSDNTDVVTVDALGLVKGIAPGKATVAAVSVDNEKIIAECTVTVIKTVPIKAAKITDGNITLVVGAHKRLTCKVTDPSDPSTATQEIVWSCDSTKYATVSDKGLVRAVKEGSAKVFISAGGKKLDSISVTVSKIAVEQVEIQLDSTEVTLAVDSTQQLSAKVTPDNATYPSIIWKSDNARVATVDSTGLVTAIASGFAWIIAISDDDKEKVDSVRFIVPMPEVDD